MSAAERWVHRPQNIWLRKAIFQRHLWTGIGLGLYVLLISLSGSMIVFRNELYTSLWNGAKTVAISGPHLSPDQLRTDIRRAYPAWELEYMWPSRKQNLATEVWLTQNGKRKARDFDPYTRKDLGSSVPWTIAFLAQVIEFHKNLLAGDTGRIVNAAGGLLVTLIAVTGAIIWWPGIQSWRKSLTIRGNTNWKRLTWDLHSAIGIWTLTFVFIWGVTGIYVAFPAQFKQAVDLVIHPHYYLHFGNFAGWRVKAIWVVLGLAPSFLFVTGFIIWWNRVVGKFIGRRAVARERVGAVHSIPDGLLGKS